MRINSKIRTFLPWVWCWDTFLYALAFPIVQCVVNRQLDVLQYSAPLLVASTFGGLINLKITEKDVMRMLYDRWFWQITAFDALVWLAYFSLWIAGAVPDRWYPMAASIMRVTTVELSIAIRMEFKNRLFPASEDRTEFENACGIVENLYNSLACVILIVSCAKSMLFGQIVLMVAMIVDNAVVLCLWRRFERSCQQSRRADS